MKTMTLTILATLFFSISAQAQFRLVDCINVSGNQKDLTLVVLNNDVKQVRVSSRFGQRALVPNKLAHQNLPGVTLYSVVGVPGLMQVSNTIFEEKSGIVRLSTEEFSCL